MAGSKKLLVVDDDKDLVGSLKAFFEGRGYAVTTARSGKEALDAVARQKPDLIILDIMMDHDADGFNAAYKLNTDEATRRIPIVILSGFMQHYEGKRASFDFIQGRDWPAAKMFEKPVKLPELAASVEKLIAEAEALNDALAS